MYLFGNIVLVFMLINVVSATSTSCQDTCIPDSWCSSNCMHYKDICSSGGFSMVKMYLCIVCRVRCQECCRQFKDGSKENDFVKINVEINGI